MYLITATETVLCCYRLTSHRSPRRRYRLAGGRYRFERRCYRRRGRRGRRRKGNVRRSGRVESKRRTGRVGAFGVANHTKLLKPSRNFFYLVSSSPRKGRLRHGRRPPPHPLPFRLSQQKRAEKGDERVLLKSVEDKVAVVCGCSLMSSSHHHTACVSARVDSSSCDL